MFENNRVEEAVLFATQAHYGKCRKGTNLPYILHPMEAAVIASALTEKEDVIIAALLHDTVEDTDVTANDIEKKFGTKVMCLVIGDTENKMENLPAADTWKIRKQATIDYITNKATLDEKIVVFADKLSNLRSIHRDQEKLGDELWNRFNQKDKSQHAWYYRSFIDSCIEFKDTPECHEYQALFISTFE